MEFNATFFVSVISFLVFTWVMNIILYAPISKITAERNRMIDDLLKDTSVSKEKIEKLVSEKEETVLKSSEMSRKIIADKVDKANKKADVLTLNAKNASMEEIALKKEELLKTETDVKGKLDEAVQSLADEIVSKVLG